jgi:hypothetical protein
MDGWTDGWLVGWLVVLGWVGLGWVGLVWFGLGCLFVCLFVLFCLFVCWFVCLFVYSLHLETYPLHHYHCAFHVALEIRNKHICITNKNNSL